MEFVNDTQYQARFDYYDNDLIQQQVTLQGEETRVIEDEFIRIPGNIAVTLFLMELNDFVHCMEN